jgi:hypothetical protein
MTKTLTRLATYAVRANPSALLTFGVASIAAGVMLATGTYGAAWRALATVVATMGQHPTLYALAIAALVSFAAAVAVWEEAHR